jgi:hypothetical protein
MYFVAKLYSHCTPSIVERFENKEHAIQYAKIMTESGKGAYIVLTPIEEYTPPTPILK